MNPSSKKYNLQRTTRSSGKIHTELYNSGMQKQSVNCNTSIMKSKLSKSVLENAGITNGGQKTNSDRYLATRLTREFDCLLKLLGIASDEPVGKV